MPGPVPKDPKLRQRRNRVSTSAKLPTGGWVQGIPELPRRPDRRKWHKWTLGWWHLVWTSPMAAEYLESDVPGMIRLAVLIDDFNRVPDPNLAKEIRLQEQRFGLSPIDRRRLQWEVERVESATKKDHRSAQSPARADDPRAALHIVQ